MPLLAIPNVSEARSQPALEKCANAALAGGAALLDLHSDTVHNRSVLTVSGSDEALLEGMVALAVACREIDLTKHDGVHPRVGVLDVCPFVPLGTQIQRAIEVAHLTGFDIAKRAQVPLFFYGEAALRDENRELPSIRRGGLAGLIERIADGFVPDAGPHEVDPSIGVVCVGARGPLIAFNVWVTADLDDARYLADQVREPGRIRALGLEMGDGRSQVSMNLTAPNEVGIEDAFARVEAAAESENVEIVATEIVGLVPERFMPDPDAKAARLFIEPGRSLESVLDD
jgi:glutamate formiminotransferase